MNAFRCAALAAVCGLLGTPAAAPAATTPDLARGYNAFGFALLGKLEAANPNENVFVSPTSVAIALAMTANGAAGTTRDAILATLGAGNVPMTSFNGANATLLKSLHDPGPDIQFSVANAIWLNKSIAIEPAFTTVNRDVFGATAQNVPFGDPQAAATINAWVKTNTAGLIPAIVDSTDPNEVAVLTNAIAMKAKWQDPFKKSGTRDAPFHAIAGQTTVSMMSRSGSIEYAQHDGWQVARLPYCCSNRFAMYVVLPKEGVTLAAALQKLDAAGFESAIAGTQAQPLLFEMPRYTATFKATLNDALEQLGMGVAFGTGADFGNLVAPPARAAISQVNHRTFVKVDEAGTEAAAATSVGIVLMAMQAPPSTRMIVDRPFLTAIRDDQTHQLLFLGAVVNPKQ